MAGKLEAGVVVINNKNKTLKNILILLFSLHLCNAQAQDSTSEYKKRVLETTEVDFLSS